MLRYKLIALTLICLALAACNPSAEEKTLPKGSNLNNAEQTNEIRRVLPECAQRNKDGMYKFPGGCSAEQWVEWQKAQDAMISPSR